ncbi:putative Site-specific recombinase, phage integrase family [uncultured spirochete]|uniref:Putative Site-specific recombinase, phage integrase family n=1 Tax=uncultured spirochete TaxID=156406 RepID=A0A3P3XPT7_9SPIR|nr:putative Site-specific recombinase, phage integrase family [uncultured spirochete]
MSVRLRQKKGHLYLDTYERGKRSWEALHLTVPKDAAGRREVMALAEEYRRKREMQLFAQRHALTDPVKNKMKLIDFAEEKAKGYDKAAHLPKSIKYLKPYASETLLADVDERFVDGYRAYLLEQKTLGATSARHYLDAFRALMAQAVRERLIEVNPAKNVRTIKIKEAKRPFLTVDEIQALFNTPITGETLAEDCKRAFLLSCFTGLRLGDLKTLTWGDIQREPEPAISKIMNKTGEIITIPLVPSAWRILDDKQLHRRDELVFPALAKSTSEYKPLDRWRKTAGIDKKFGWHAARHSFAMMSLDVSGDIYAVSRLLGHSDIKITTAYLHFMDARKRQILDALPDIDTQEKGEALKFKAAE